MDLRQFAHFIFFAWIFSYVSCTHPVQFSSGPGNSPRVFKFNEGAPNANPPPYQGSSGGGGPQPPYQGPGGGGGPQPPYQGPGGGGGPQPPYQGPGGGGPQPPYQGPGGGPQPPPFQGPGGGGPQPSFQGPAGGGPPPYYANNNYDPNYNNYPTTRSPMNSFTESQWVKMQPGQGGGQNWQSGSGGPNWQGGNNQGRNGNSGWQNNKQSGGEWVAYDAAQTSGPGSSSAGTMNQKSGQVPSDPQASPQGEVQLSQSKGTALTASGAQISATSSVSQTTKEAGLQPKNLLKQFNFNPWQKSRVNLVETVRENITPSPDKKFPSQVRYLNSQQGVGKWVMVGQTLGTTKGTTKTTTQGTTPKPTPKESLISGWVNKESLQGVSGRQMETRADMNVASGAVIVSVAPTMKPELVTAPSILNLMKSEQTLAMAMQRQPNVPAQEKPSEGKTAIQQLLSNQTLMKELKSVMPLIQQISGNGGQETAAKTSVTSGTEEILLQIQPTTPKPALSEVQQSKSLTTEEKLIYEQLLTMNDAQVSKFIDMVGDQPTADPLIAQLNNILNVAQETAPPPEPTTPQPTTPRPTTPQPTTTSKPMMMIDQSALIDQMKLILLQQLAAETTTASTTTTTTTSTTTPAPPANMFSEAQQQSLIEQVKQMLLKEIAPIKQALTRGQSQQKQVTRTVTKQQEVVQKSQVQQPVTKQQEVVQKAQVQQLPRPSANVGVIQKQPAAQPRLQTPQPQQLQRQPSELSMQTPPPTQSLQKLPPTQSVQKSLPKQPPQRPSLKQPPQRPSLNEPPQRPSMKQPPQRPSMKQPPQRPSLKQPPQIPPSQQAMQRTTTQQKQPRQQQPTVKQVTQQSNAIQGMQRITARQKPKQLSPKPSQQKIQIQMNIQNSRAQQRGQSLSGVNQIKTTSSRQQSSTAQAAAKTSQAKVQLSKAQQVFGKSGGQQVQPSKPKGPDPFSQMMMNKQKINVPSKTSMSKTPPPKPRANTRQNIQNQQQQQQIQPIQQQLRNIQNKIKSEISRKTSGSPSIDFESMIKEKMQQMSGTGNIAMAKIPQSNLLTGKTKSGMKGDVVSQNLPNQNVLQMMSKNLMKSKSVPMSGGMATNIKSKVLTGKTVGGLGTQSTGEANPKYRIQNIRDMLQQKRKQSTTKPMTQLEVQEQAIKQINDLAEIQNQQAGIDFQKLMQELRKKQSKLRNSPRRMDVSLTVDQAPAPVPSIQQSNVQQPKPKPTMPSVVVTTPTPLILTAPPKPVPTPSFWDSFFNFEITTPFPGRKRGSCPVASTVAVSCNRICNKDSECSGRQKCCHSGNNIGCCSDPETPMSQRENSMLMSMMFGQGEQQQQQQQQQGQGNRGLWGQGMGGGWGGRGMQGLWGGQAGEMPGL